MSRQIVSSRRPQRWRTVTAGAVLALGLPLAGCGFSAQTLQPYTPAEGVDVTVGGDSPTGVGVKGRNLSIIVDPASGEGILSGQLVAGAADTLISVTGQALDQNGRPTGDLTVALPDGALELPAGGSVVLTDGVAKTVSGPLLTPGLTADLTYTFDQAGSTTVAVPLIDGTKADYVTVSPSPAGSPSGSASPTPGSTPS